VKKKHRNWY